LDHQNNYVEHSNWTC